MSRFVPGLLAILLLAGCPRPRTPGRVTRLTPTMVQGIFRLFEPELRAFSWTNAYLAAIASMAAYERQDEPTRRLIMAMGFDRIAFLNQGTTQAWVASNPQMVLIAFRGTEINRFADIRTDAAVCQRPALGGLVHRGFYAGLELVWGELLREVRRQGRKGASFKPIWITGHSLGGALATLAALRLDRARVPVRGIITLGQPRVVDRALAARFPGRERVYRITNQGDPVALVPVRYQWRILRGLNKKCPFDYRHVGVAREFRCARGRGCQVAQVEPAAPAAAPPDAPGPRRAARGLAGFFRRLSSLFTVGRHLLGRYLKNIWQRLPGPVRRQLPPPAGL